MSKEFDESIFDSIRVEFGEMISAYQKERVVESDLYMIDDAAMAKIKEFETRLDMEYGGDEKTQKKCNISKITKVINPDEVATYYKPFAKEKWEQVNNREKVLNRLESKYNIWKNSLIKNTKGKLAEIGAPSSVVKETMKRVDMEIEEGARSLDYIIENFEELDVMISGYELRKKYGAVQYKSGGKFCNTTLRLDVANVLWYKKERSREDNETALFIEKAKKAFGIVYYAPRDFEVQKRIEARKEKRKKLKEAKAEIEKGLR